MEDQSKIYKKKETTLEKLLFRKPLRRGKNFIENKNPFSISDFRYGIFMKHVKKNAEQIIFQVHGFDFSFSNALRRILLSEVSVFAIDKVFFYDNSSIMNDEIIAHRLGMIPIFISPHFIDFSIKNKAKNILKIILNFKVSHQGNFFKNISVYSNSLKWKKYGIFK